MTRRSKTTKTAAPPPPAPGPRKVMVYLYPAALRDLARLTADEARETGRPGDRLASAVIAQALRREVRCRGLDGAGASTETAT